MLVLWRKFAIFAFLLLLGAVGYADTEWQALNEGIEYALLHPIAHDDNAKLHAFRIDLHHYQLELARDRTQHSAYVSDLAEARDALIGINGGFFSPKMEPLGLRISAGAEHNPLRRNVSWWGIFTIQNQTARVFSPSAFIPSTAIDFAIQTGPRLVINGKIPSLKEGYSQRSALGIDASGHVIIVITEKALLSTRDLADILQRPLADDGLACVNAINLDGGTSSQLYANINDFSLDIPSLRSVADAIIVVPRKAS